MKKEILIALATILCVVSTTFPAQAGDDLEAISDLPRQSRLALFSAQEYLEKGEPGNAASELEEYLAEHPDRDNYLIRFHLGNILMQLDRPEDALVQFQRAVELEPRHEDSWLNLGETAFSTENYTIAAGAILKGHELSEDKRPELLYYASAAHILGDEPEKSIPLLEQLVSGDHGEPRYEWYRALISACVTTKDVERGELAVASMLKQFSDDPEAWSLAFECYASLGDYKQAAVALTVVGYLRPLERRELIQLGDIYSAIQAPHAATEFYRVALADSASASEVERIASAYISSYDLEPALEILQKEIKEEPTYRLWSLLGDLYFMEKRYTESMDAFAHCSKLDPEEPRPFLMMGYCAMELEEWDDALVNLTRAGEHKDYTSRADALIRRVSRKMAGPSLNS